MKQFRFLSYLFVAVLCLGFVSCSDDDDFEDSQIVGTWTVTKEEGYEYVDGEKDPWNESYKDGEWVYVLNEDGTGEEYEDNYGPYGFTWKLKNGNKLTLDFNYIDEPRTVKITKLNGTNLVFEYKGEDEDGYDFYSKVTLKKYQMPK